ncbi:uncharacterized protein LOC135829287 isoform X1 [Sycon ciliatum]|uniref:uncharacterized protein LOC135829287 isoform X1 n=1 Tax=Sycon ciliatum TaxID=27933 RepID=UPI0031F6077A
MAACLEASGKRQCVLFCSYIAVDAFERACTPSLLAKIKSLLGRTWRERCRELVGGTVKDYIPSEAAEQADIYLLCSLMVKLNSQLMGCRRSVAVTKPFLWCPAQDSPVGNDVADEARVIDEIQAEGVAECPGKSAGLDDDCRRVGESQSSPVSVFRCEEVADSMRHLANVLLVFRQKLFHEPHVLSIGEVLSSLLCMQELCELLSSSCSFPEVPQLGPSQQGDFPVLDEHRRQEALGELHLAIVEIRHLAEVSSQEGNVSSGGCSGHASGNGYQASKIDAGLQQVTASRRLALKMIGLATLRSLSLELQPIVLYIQHGQDASSAAAIHDNPGMQVHTDIQTMYIYLKKGVLACHKACMADAGSTGPGRAEDRAKMMESYSRLEDRLLRNASVAFPKPQKVPDGRGLMTKLGTALEVVCGKAGLRNYVCHTNCAALTENKMSLYMKSAQLILRMLAGGRECHEIAQVAKDLSSMVRNPKTPAVAIVFNRLAATEDMGTSIDNGRLPLLVPKAKLFGREQDIATLTMSLLADRLTVIIGELGMGKTAVAAQVASQCSGELPEQYWLSGTSQASIQLGISRIGRMNTPGGMPVTSGDLASAEHSLIDVGMKYLSTASNLLLVIDDVRNPRLLMSVLQVQNMQRHAVICTSLSTMKSQWISCTPSAALHELLPLSTHDALDYLVSKCPKLRDASVMPQLLSDATLWRFVESSLCNCPLALELTAHVLSDSDTTQDIAKQIYMACDPATSASLASSTPPFLQDIAVGAGKAKSLRLLQVGKNGESRYCRSIVATTSLLLDQMSESNAIVMVALSFLGRAGCQIPIFIIERILNSMPATVPGLATDMANGEDQSQDTGHHDPSTGCSKANSQLHTTTLHKLHQLGLITFHGDMIRVSILVQRSIEEILVKEFDSDTSSPSSEAAEAQECESSSLDWKWTSLSKAGLVKLLTGNLLKFFQDQQQCNRAERQRYDISSVLPLAESMLATCSKSMETEQHLQLLLYFARLTYSYHSDWQTSLRYFELAKGFAEILDRSGRVGETCCSAALVQAEYASMLWHCGQADCSIRELNKVINMLDARASAENGQSPSVCLKEYCTGQHIDTGWFRHVAQQELWNATICNCQSDLGSTQVRTPVEMLISRSTNPTSSSQLAAGSARLTTGPLSRTNISAPETEPTIPASFWDAMRVWSTQDVARGIDMILEVTVDIIQLAEEAGVRSTLHQLGTISMLLQFCSMVSAEETFDFCNTLLADVSARVLKELLHSEVSPPCVHTIPSSAGREWELTGRFYEKFLPTIQSACQVMTASLINTGVTAGFLGTFLAADEAAVLLCRTALPVVVDLLIAFYRVMTTAIQWHMPPALYGDFIQSYHTEQILEGWRQYELYQHASQPAARRIWGPDTEQMKGYQWLVSSFMKALLRSPCQSKHLEYRMDGTLRAIGKWVEGQTEYPVYSMGVDSVFAERLYDEECATAVKTARAASKGRVGPGVFMATSMAEQSDGASAAAAAPAVAATKKQQLQRHQQRPQLDVSLDQFIAEVCSDLHTIGVHVKHDVLLDLAITSKAYHRSTLVNLVLDHMNNTYY